MHNLIPKNLLQAFTLLLSTILLQGCGVYSFTGVNIDPRVKSISVSQFNDRTANGPANLSISFSEDLREYYQRNTSLDVMRNNGDLQLSGYIKGYNTAPVASTGNDVAAKMRLTISVMVNYTHTINDDESFEREFSYYADYDQSQTLEQVEEGLIEEINEQIFLNIFNATVADW